MSTDWRWTDEDSRALDEQTRRMRRPPKYRPPVTTREADAVIKRPVTTLDQFLSRPGRRKSNRGDDPEVIQRKWAKTKRDLERAGIRPVETTTTPPDAHPRMDKPAAHERSCIDCGEDISSRGPTSTRCTEHAYKHKVQSRRARLRKENGQ